MKNKLIYDDKSNSLKGHWKLEVYKGDIQKNKDGCILNELQEIIEGDNLITTVGKGMIMDRLFGLSAIGAMTRIGVGTNNTPAAVGDISLTGSTFIIYDSTPTRAGLVVTCIATFGTAVANIVWAELGMDNSTTLLNRISPIGPFTKTSAVSIVVTCTITQS